jgi:hypothetical protein
MAEFVPQVSQTPTSVGELLLPVEGKCMMTGLNVIESGLYASECCLEEIWLDQDQCFPRCWTCKGLTKWELVELPKQLAA